MLCIHRSGDFAPSVLKAAPAGLCLQSSCRLDAEGQSHRSCAKKELRIGCGATGGAESSKRLEEGGGPIRTQPAFNKHPLGARHQDGKDERRGLGVDRLKFSGKDLCMQIIS